jgi:peptidoglycan/LPS O-acetylase OafA/YrhL
MIAYRKDVDGLRAIAVMAVVVYHCSEALLPGGFIGVDVFFVISGYLITRLVASDIARGRFSIAEFYVRRTKRIFPALFVVLLSTLAIGVFLLAPSELSNLGRTTAATASFVSNIMFWQETGYFDTAAERKPLLHTWSLAVEEQFYLLWPVTLFLLAKMRIRFQMAVWSIVVLSFGASCYLAVRQPPAAFFLLPARGWELLTGAALALGMLPVPRRRVARELSAAAGLTLVGLALFTLDRNSLFPGWNALLPCVGTALLIASGESGVTFVGRRLLMLRPVVFIGLISYSLYLWHWPLLALARVTQRGELSPDQAAGVAAIAALLSIATWRLIEIPLRAKGPSPSPGPILARYAVVSVAVFLLGAATYRSGGLIRFADPALARAERARYDINPLSQQCLRWQSAVGPLATDACVSGQEQFKRRLVVWGDSHADSAAPGFARLANDHRYATQQLTMAACPPLPQARVAGPGANYDPCHAFNKQVLEYVTQTPAVEVVALVARWTLYTENARFGDDPGPITYLVDDEDPTQASAASKRVFKRALAATLHALSSAGKSVIILGTIPPMGMNVPDCFARNELPWSGYSACNSEASVVLPHLRFADSEIVQLAGATPGVCSYLPKEALCPGGVCLGAADNDILYANDDHLTLPGALFLSRHLNVESCLKSVEMKAAETGDSAPSRINLAERASWAPATPQ